MKLYVWDDPYEVSYGNSLLYVVASNLRQARKIAKIAPCGQWDHKSKGVNVDRKKPSRVRKLPYGEYAEWSE